MTTTMLTEDDLDPVMFLAATNPDAMKAMNAELIDGFRATNGRLGGSFEGVPLLLLTTTGARSGLARTTPVNYTRAGQGYVVVASKSGAPRHPDWSTTCSRAQTPRSRSWALRSRSGPGSPAAPNAHGCSAGPRPPCRTTPCTRTAPAASCP
jgi:hypothetical protein